MNNKELLQIASTILQQIKAGDKWSLVSWGARNKYALSTEKTELGYQLGGVRFDIRTPKIKRGGKVFVRLMVDDTYTVQAFRYFGGKVTQIGETRSNVYFDELVPVIDSLIETEETQKLIVRTR